MNTSKNHLAISLVIIFLMSACHPTQPPVESVSVPTQTRTPTLLPTTPSTPSYTPTPNPTTPPMPTNTLMPIPTIPPPEEFHVNPIDGLNPDFIMGADVSMLGEIEKI